MAFLGNMWKVMWAQGLIFMEAKVKIKEKSRKGIPFLDGYFSNF